MYENLGIAAIYKALKKVNGTAVSSDTDSDMWQRLLYSKQHKKSQQAKVKL